MGLDNPHSAFGLNQRSSEFRFFNSFYDGNNASNLVGMAKILGKVTGGTIVNELSSKIVMPVVPVVPIVPVVPVVSKPVVAVLTTLAAEQADLINSQSMPKKMRKSTSMEILSSNASKVRSSGREAVAVVVTETESFSREIDEYRVVLLRV